MKLVTLDYTLETGKFRNKNIEQVINTDSKYLNYFLNKNKDHRFNSDVIKLAQTKVQLKFNKKMIDTLKFLNCEVSNILLDLNTKLVKSIFTNIKASNRHKDSVTFDVPFTTKKNSTIKVGRFVKKLLELNDVKVTDVAIEEFSVNFYSSFSLDRTLELKIVKGETIRDLYSEDKYFKNTGSLGNSCMRHFHCRSYFDLYAKNDEVTMLVLMDKATQKITARAIIWNKTKFTYKDSDTNELVELDNPFMDRVYTNNHKHSKIFFDYAKTNGIIRKRYQSYSYKNDFVFNSKNIKGKMVATLSEVTYNRPYLDTMAYVLNGTELSNGYDIY